MPSAWHALRYTYIILAVEIKYTEWAGHGCLKLGGFNQKRKGHAKSDKKFYTYVANDITKKYVYASEQL